MSADRRPPNPYRDGRPLTAEGGEVESRRFRWPLPCPARVVADVFVRKFNLDALRG